MKNLSNPKAAVLRCTRLLAGSMAIALGCAAATTSANAQQTPRGPVRISSGVMAGLKISGDAPVIPPEAAQAHIAGMVVLHAIISAEGLIDAVQAISGPEPLRAAAVQAVKTWRYKPFLLNGQPVAVDTTITCIMH